MNVKTMFAACTAKLRGKPSSFVPLENQILGSLTSQSWLGSQLPGADKWISNCGVSTEYQDSSFLPHSQKKMLPPLFHPVNNLGKVTQAIKPTSRIKYSRGQVTVFVHLETKNGIVSSGDAKNVRIHTNPGREGTQFGEKQPPHPTQRKADLS